MPRKQPKCTPLEYLCRETLEREQLETLSNMAEAWEDIVSHTVDAASLEPLNISIGEPLDVDENMAPDLTTFFLP